MEWNKRNSKREGRHQRTLRQNKRGHGKYFLDLMSFCTCIVPKTKPNPSCEVCESHNGEYKIYFSEM